MLFTIGGTIGAASGALIAGRKSVIMFAALSGAIGLGSLSVLLDSQATTGEQVFGAIFGLGFAIVGAVVCGAVIRTAIGSLRAPAGPPTKSGARAATPALARQTVAIFGTASRHPDPIASAYKRSPNASAIDPDSVSATASLSLFDAANFSHALAIAERHLGAGAEIESAELYPGDLELQVPDGGHEIDGTVMANGYWTSISWPSDGPADVLALAQFGASVPATLPRRISTAATTRPWPANRGSQSSRQRGRGESPRGSLETRRPSVAARDSGVFISTTLAIGGPRCSDGGPRRSRVLGLNSNGRDAHVFTVSQERSQDCKGTGATS
jgi:hypothetical protein